MCVGLVFLLVAIGQMQGLLPGFSASKYLEFNPDVKKTGVDPVQHFMTTGYKEGRKIQINDPANISHMGTFSLDDYLKKYPDLAPNLGIINADVPTKLQALFNHYQIFGYKEGRVILSNATTQKEPIITFSPNATKEQQAQILDLYALSLKDLFGATKVVTTNPQNEVEEMALYFENAKRQGTPIEGVVKHVIEEVLPQNTPDRKARLIAALVYNLKSAWNALLVPVYIFMNPTSAPVSLVIGETTCSKEETVVVEAGKNAYLQANGCPLQTLVVKDVKTGNLLSQVKTYDAPIEKDSIWAIKQENSWVIKKNNSWVRVAPNKAKVIVKNDPTGAGQRWNSYTYTIIDYKKP